MMFDLLTRRLGWGRPTWPVATVCIPLLLCAGCSKGKDYYLAHAKDRADKLQECSLQPGQMMRDDDCEAAGEAEFEAKSAAKR